MDQDQLQPTWIDLGSEGFEYISDIARWACDKSGIVMAAEFLSDYLYLSALVCTLPPRPSVEVMSLALTLNLHQQATGGGALGYDMAGGSLVLYRRLAIRDITKPQLEEATSDLANAASLLRTQYFSAEMADL